MAETDLEHVIGATDVQQLERTLVLRGGLPGHDVSQQTAKESRWAAGLAGNERWTAHHAFRPAGTDVEVS